MTLAQIFAKVLNMSLTASLVIVLVIAARFILRKSPKVFSYALWAVVLFRLLCPVSLPSPVSLLGLLDAPVAESDGITSSVEYVPTNAGGYREIIVQKPVRTENPDVPVPQQNQQADVQPQVKSVSAAEIITYVWIAGMAVLFLVGIGSYFRFRRHLTGACQVKGNIYLVDHIDSAFVAGLFSPKIYLPSDLPVKQMRYIIAHEQYHLRRFDHIAKHLAFAALCIHWFNPMVWAAFILSGKDMEMSCDEAVIKKLGEGIRADYSASLLTLAMGHRIIAGSPLAFGEGDTKGRIKNMAKWKQPKKWVSVLSWIVCLAVLTACAANPEKEVVTSKNDGSFDANVVLSATKPAEGQDAPANQRVQYTDSFSSTDGSVEFTIGIDEEITALPMPVVEVVPHYLTAEDAKRVATALLGDVDWFEREPLLEPKYTKEQILEKNNRWTQYANSEAISELLAREPEYTDSVVANVKRFIEKYSELYESATSGSPKACEWTFKKESYGFHSAETLAGQDLSEENDVIYAVAKVGEVEYTFSAAIRNMSDFKLNNIYLYLGDGSSPSSIDSNIYQAKLCRTEKPTDDDIAAVVAKAEKMLHDMDLGQWQIDSTSIHTTYYGDTPEYTINVSAVPVFNGTSAARVPQIGNLKSTLAYASNYYFTDASFQFSANGDLVSFSMFSPIDTKGLLNENVAVKSMDELMELAKNHLTLSDYYEYGLSADYLDSTDTQLTCHVDICQMKYGMLRVKVPNNDENYYYVPGMVLYGTVDYLESETGALNVSSGAGIWNDRIIPIVAVNAVDGSNIELYIN